MNKSRQEKLVGVVVSLPSFCDQEYNLLLDRQRRHIRWLVDHGMTEGAAVLMICGGLGEGYFLDDDEWRAMALALAEEARGKVPTMIGVFELSARRAAKKAQYAADVGIDFIQLAPPHYMVPSEEDVYRHYRYVNDNADVGILAYNIPWAMPKQGFEFSAKLLERLSELENVVGVKWSSSDVRHYLRMLRLFSDRFNFVDNMMIFSLGFRMGMKGFINFHANVAPRLALEQWKLLQQQKYDEFDQLWLKLNFDPFIKVVRPEEQAWVGVGEGPTSRLTLRAFGMEAGPAFPAQTEPPAEYLEAARRAIEASGITEWVDWDQSIFG
jgi:4-hydroxy-tetrahydrodipicolinate synthase